MENKQLYQFTLDKEVEKIVESTRKNKKTGEETITKKKVKEKIPVEVQVKRPNRRELEEAELEYSIEMSKCIKRGILTKAMLGKKYSDTGGLFSEDDSENYAKMYKDALDLQNEYIRLETVKKRTKAQESRFDKLKGEVAVNRKEIIDFESNFQSLFDHTADVKAQNRVLLWYCLHLTFVYDEERDRFVKYFEGEDFDEKITSYYDLEEADDPFYWDLIKKVTTVVAFWYFNQASTQEEFHELIEKAESGELTDDAKAEEEK
tara:strand:- start:3249 stop:4034 length:786 start_codon:yes stop_codon:yes gene_type:complete